MVRVDANYKGLMLVLVRVVVVVVIIFWVRLKVAGKPMAWKVLSSNWIGTTAEGTTTQQNTTPTHINTM